MWHTTHLFVIIKTDCVHGLCLQRLTTEKENKMGIVQIAAFAIMVIWIAYKEKETVTDVIPVVTCLLTLCLCGLAFGGRLSWSDYGALFVCLVAIIWGFALVRKKQIGELGDFLKAELKKPGVIVGLAILLFVPLLTSQKVVTWWDDYNFWATDVKALYYLDGFAKKYQNVAPEFGDYPPGTQMLKWWFMHFRADELQEGLMFSGYYFMNLCFLLPLLRFVKKTNPFIMVLSAIVLWLFPTCTEVFGMDGCCADLTMALIYGAFLVAVADKDGHSELFYYARLSLYLMVMVLCKNTGFIWVAFGLLFAYGYEIFRHKYGQKAVAVKTVKRMIVVTILPVLAEAGWLLFCLGNRRVAKLTGAAVRMATGNMNVPEVKEEMIDAFVTAFISYPLHRWKTFSVDLSPLALYLLLTVFVIILYKKKLITKWQCRYVGAFLAISGAVFYSINLLSHLTIFAVETQYLEPFGMVSSIERYGAPFTIGGLYLLAYFALKTDKQLWGINRGLLVCMGFVLLTANYECAYRGIIGYRDIREQTLQERADIIDGQARQFLERVGARQWGSGKRVLYLRDASDVSWVRNTYIGFEAAPVSVMYGNIDGATVNETDIVRAIDDAHAGYLYADEITGGNDAFMQLTDDMEFEYGCLYEVHAENGEVTLLKVNE